MCFQPAATAAQECASMPPPPQSTARQPAAPGSRSPVACVHPRTLPAPSSGSACQHNPSSCPRRHTGARGKNCAVQAGFQAQGAAPAAYYRSPKQNSCARPGNLESRCSANHLARSTNAHANPALPGPAASSPAQQRHSAAALSSFHLNRSASPQPATPAAAFRCLTSSAGRLHRAAAARRCVRQQGRWKPLGQQRRVCGDIKFAMRGSCRLSCCARRCSRPAPAAVPRAPQGTRPAAPWPPL